jgi:hypothetical protein
MIIIINIEEIIGIILDIEEIIIIIIEEMGI